MCLKEWETRLNEWEVRPKAMIEFPPRLANSPLVNPEASMKAQIATLSGTGPWRRGVAEDVR
ncbi:MAG: hypothetical protein JW986_02715 [Methanotrichaceae archaeon]|nr:hypothetical protein [Methanotrichaceae archaeon]